jgi:quercetin 2,3-dioxygenase
MTISPTIDVRRAADRFATRLDWLDSHHSFSFSRHYDPANTHHGLLLVNNDDVVRAGTGFSTHPHQDMEIVTWVLDGELEHKDSVGHRGILGTPTVTAGPEGAEVLIWDMA